MAVNLSKVRLGFHNLDLAALAKKTAAYISVALVCLLLAWLVVFFPPMIVVALAGSVIYLVLLILAPWAGIGAYISVLLLSPDFKIADVVTVLTLGVFGFRLALAGELAKFPIRRFLPYVIFMVLMLVSVLIGKFIFHNEVPFIYRDGRVLLYWLWFPIVYMMAVMNDKGNGKIWSLIVFLGVLISLLALLQYVTGVQIVGEGRVGSLETMGDYDQSAIRVQMPGFYFVSIVLIAALLFANSAIKRFVWLLPVILVLAFALYANFGRALWTWTAVAVFSSAFFLGAARGSRMLGILALVGVLGLSGLGFYKPAALESISYRIVSIFSEGGARTSYGWRKLENQDALRHIASSPMVGVGMGGEYRNWMGEVSTFKEHTRYIHHSYLYVALKAGLPALVSVLFFLWAAWWAGWKTFASDRAGGVADMRLIAALVGLPAVMALSITQPELMSAFGALFYSLIAAFLFLSQGLAHQRIRHGD